jgi:quercetin dioxygenase-like cupin family protein
VTPPNVHDLQLTEIWSNDDPTQRTRFAFPVSVVMGAQSTSVVYFELEPGNRIGRHTDSAEEVLLILEGRGEATVGDVAVPLETGAFAVVPALSPHDLVNQGDSPLRVLGFFSSSTIVSVFDHAWQPFGVRIVGTPTPEPE